MGRIKRENKNIFLHIIDEDYKSKNQEQNERIDASDKTIQLTDEKDPSVVERLRKMHDNFTSSAEPEGSEKASDINQTNLQDSCESIGSTDISELYISYQRIKADEQELIAQKQDLLLKEQELREKLLKEICEKKKAVEVLQLEISALQNTCEEITQGLLPTTK